MFGKADLDPDLLLQLKSRILQLLNFYQLFPPLMLWWWTSESLVSLKVRVKWQLEHLYLFKI